MQNWMIWTDVRVTDEAFRRFVSGFGSRIGDRPDEAVIERDKANVYIGTATTEDESNVLRDDLQYAAERMGRVPMSMLSIRIGHGRGSLQLARQVASTAIETWGGFLDHNEG